MFLLFKKICILLTLFILSFHTKEILEKKPIFLEKKERIDINKEKLKKILIFQKKKSRGFIFYLLRYYFTHLVLLSQAIFIVASFTVVLEYISFKINNRFDDDGHYLLRKWSHFLHKKYYFDHVFRAAAFLIFPFIIYHFSHFFLKEKAHLNKLLYYNSLFLFIGLGFGWIAFINKEEKHKKWWIFNAENYEETNYWSSFFIIGFLEWMIYEKNVVVFDLTPKSWGIKLIRKKFYTLIEKNKKHHKENLKD